MSMEYKTELTDAEKDLVKETEEASLDESIEDVPDSQIHPGATIVIDWHPSEDAHVIGYDTAQGQGPTS